IADLLHQAGDENDPKLVAVVVSWLSGELPQRQIGVGWAALRSLPDPADEPSLTVLQVDAAFSEIGGVAGKGSQARRAELVNGLFAAATEREQAFLRRLLGGELRQGALVGVMADAVAKAADVRAPVVRRSTSSRSRSDSRWVRCSPRPRPVSARPSNASVAQRLSRRNWMARGCRSTAQAMRCRSTPAASTTSPSGC